MGLEGGCWMLRRCDCEDVVVIGVGRWVTVGVVLGNWSQTGVG